MSAIFPVVYLHFHQLGFRAFSLESDPQPFFQILKWSLVVSVDGLFMKTLQMEFAAS
jgi:hypothetical protein